MGDPGVCGDCGIPLCSCEVANECPYEESILIDLETVVFPCSACAGCDGYCCSLSDLDETEAALVSALAEKVTRDDVRRTAPVRSDP